MQQTLPMDTGIEESGQCLVDAKYFSEIIRKVSGQSIDVDCTDNLMHIKCGKLDSNLLAQTYLSIQGLI